jgi:flagellum-specific peptidoglycan hydrolase FlgJ
MKKLFIILLLIISCGVELTPCDMKYVLIKQEPPVMGATLDDCLIWMEEYNIQYPRIVLAQIILETGWLKSRIYKENNNLFGMKLAKKRVTTAIGSNLNHAIYSNLRSSIEDYAIWQHSKYKGGDYYAFLKDVGYATDENYINKLKLLI